MNLIIFRLSFRTCWTYTGVFLWKLKTPCCIQLAYNNFNNCRGFFSPQMFVRIFLNKQKIKFCVPLLCCICTVLSKDKLEFCNLCNALHTAPKDSENCVINNYGAGRLFSVTNIFIMDCWRSAAKVISNEIYKSFGTVYRLLCGCVRTIEELKTFRPIQTFLARCMFICAINKLEKKSAIIYPRDTTSKGHNIPGTLVPVTHSHGRDVARTQCLSGTKSKWRTTLLPDCFESFRLK
jgi:hypothetical protein